MQHIYETILKTAIKSHQHDTQQLQKRCGGIFIVTRKEHFNGNVRGRIVTNYEQLNGFTNKATHWTPNAYSKYTYTDDAREHIAGFAEQNLLQVNTFVVDIDTKRHSVQDILTTCLDESIGSPSLILDTPSGYQVYFVLSAPIFMSNKNNGIIKKLVKVASENIKKSLRAVDADMFCNDFGFFRMPNENNIVWCQLEQTYTPDEVLSWSYNYSDGQDLYAPVKSHTKGNYRQSDWYQTLISITGAKGSKGAYGRNNLLFTIALTNYADGVSLDDAQNTLFQVNANLELPLKESEVIRTLESAYSGKYRGPKREFVEDLLTLNNIRIDKVVFGGWHKHKKERAERLRVHFNEWDEDLYTFITKHENEACELSQNALCGAIGISRSSLNELMETSTRLFKRAIGTGRNAKTLWFTISYVYNEAMKKVRSIKKAMQMIHVFIRAYNVEPSILIGTNLEQILHTNKLSTVPLHISNSPPPD